MAHLFSEVISALFGGALFVNACLFIPQIIRLYQKKNSEDVSLLTFLGFNIINLLAFLYGITIVNWILIAGYGLSLLMNSLVTLLIILYRKSPAASVKAH